MSDSALLSQFEHVSLQKWDHCCILESYGSMHQTQNYLYWWGFFFFFWSNTSHSIYYSLACECATRCHQSAVILHAHYKCLCTEVFVRIVLMESLYRVSGYLVSSVCVCVWDQTSMQYWNLKISAEKLIYQYYWSKI